MDEDAIALSHQLADYSPSEREIYYAEHAIPAAVRLEVESLLRFGRESAHSLTGHVADAAERALASLALASGTRLGPYEIAALIGSGGMGEVYKARDTRLNRSVAIKVLPSHLAGKSELKRRFDQEARAIAALNHPHICVLYDIGHRDGIDYLVMEYLEGETLAQRLRKGPLPAEQVIRYAIEIADALDKAHRQGVVHRDLKPGNIMITKSGAKVLDFGLAKLREPLGGRETAAMLDKPTEPDLTNEHTIMGTVHYMSPEQLERKKVDARSDLFAFGSVVYEMATGRKAFEGSSVASVIASVLSSEPPPVSTLQSMTPAPLAYLVKTCLRKDPEERCQTAHDALLQLQFIVESGVEAPAAARSARKRWPLAAAMMLLVAIVGLGLGALFSRRPAEKVEVIRFSVFPPESTTFPSTPGFFAISPNGRHLAFRTLDSSGKWRLWIRSLDTISARPLPGTDDVTVPFWSPDSRFVAFFAQGKLKKVDTSGGRPDVLCDVPGNADVSFGTWGRNNVIVFEGAGRLYSVPGAGGNVTPITTLDQSREERNHRFPYFLPDGRHFLYLAVSTQPGATGVYIASLDSKDVRRVLDVASNSVYVPPGYVVFADKGSVMAQPFDATNLKLAGEAFRIAESVFRQDSARAPFSISDTGVLAYRAGSEFQTTQLTWTDRTGKRLQKLGEPGEYESFELSPDEKRIAIGRRDPQMGNVNIWIMDQSRGTDSPFTFGSSSNFRPLWSRDGSEIVFGSTRDDPNNRYDNLYRKTSSGAGDEQPLLKIDNVQIHQHPTDWSSDGRYILFERTDAKTKMDLWVLPLFGDRTPFPFLQTEFDETTGRSSPDNRWVAYMSEESGRPEVYIRPFPKSNGKWQISTNGGYQPRWASQSNELFYVDLNGRLMVVTVKTNPKFEAGVPRVLFEINAAVADATYAVTADGQRFLLNVPTATSKVSPITVVVNWTAALKN